MGKRIEFNYYIALKGGTPLAFEDAIVKEASRISGGCTVSRAVGYWIEGAHKPQLRYMGGLEQEFCFHLQMAAETHRAMEINYTMRACIRQEARKHQVDIDWVHVTTHDVKEHHFQIIPGETNA